MKVLFKANDVNTGDMHYLNAVYNSLNDKNNGLPPTHVEDTSGQLVVQGKNADGSLKRNSYILSNGDELDSNDKYAPW
ncbi:MAG TPA: hypothetical protein K8W20_02990 [Pseudomonas lactis]|uniref:Uncharacterized protein n=1 Tax=Pseudomonas lactis TaxID=1615674 RepID=A0A921NEX9_9PSED|nr:hypothetical protein [Pseudomonas lactis]HJH17666.1 hypothetical protein [Pseudomonas lactis]